MSELSLSQRLKNIASASELDYSNIKNKPTGAEGQVYFLDKDGQANINLGYLLIVGRFAEDAAELTAEKNKIISFQTIFDSWTRFRIGGTAGEENSWSYNNVNDRVICTANTDGFVGFVSLDKFDEYIHEAVFSANDADDDLIGVMIAYYNDTVAGKQYTLHASRSVLSGNGGYGPAWGVVYNIGQADMKILAGGSVLMPEDGINSWSAAGQTKVKIIRDNDIITCEATPFGNISAYDATQKFTIDLVADPLLKVFRDPNIIRLK